MSILGKDIEIPARNVGILGKDIEIPARNVGILGKDIEIPARNVGILGKEVGIPRKEIHFRDRKSKSDLGNRFPTSKNPYFPPISAKPSKSPWFPKLGPNSRNQRKGAFLQCRDADSPRPCRGACPWGGGYPVVASMPIQFVDNAVGKRGENSPAIHRWEPRVKSGQSPAGTEEPILSSLAGLFSHRIENPALKRWAIVKWGLSRNRIGTVASASGGLHAPTTFRVAFRAGHEETGLSVCPAFPHSERRWWRGGANHLGVGEAIGMAAAFSSGYFASSAIPATSTVPGSCTTMRSQPLQSWSGVQSKLKRAHCEPVAMSS